MTAGAPPRQLWGDRNPWRADDPARCCYTCGHAPVGTYRDGSPRYPDTCRHEPVFPGPGDHAQPLDPCPAACRAFGSHAVRVFVPQATVDRATGTCLGRAAEARRNHRKDANGAEYRREYADDPMACVAEAAVGILWDLDVVYGVGYRPGTPDLVGGVEVRYVAWEDGSLLLKPSRGDQERADRPFVLVTGPPQEVPGGLVFTVRGWIIGRLGMIQGYWWTPTAAQHDQGRRACWRVPQAALHHPDHLPPHARKR